MSAEKPVYDFAKYDFNTSLFQAIERGDKKVVDALITLGVDVNRRHPELQDMPPLHYAAFNDQTQICESLIKAGANVAAREDRHHNTPLHYAAENSNKAMCTLFLENGADPRARNQDQQTPLGMAKIKGFEDIITLLETYPAKHSSRISPDAVKARKESSSPSRSRP